MIISQYVHNRIMVAAVDWGMSWDNADKQLSLLIEGDDSINTAQIQNVINRLGYGSAD